MSQIRFLLVWPFLPFTLPYFLTISDIYPCLLDISLQSFFDFPQSLWYFFLNHPCRRHGWLLVFKLVDLYWHTHKIPKQAFWNKQNASFAYRQYLRETVFCQYFRATVFFLQERGLGKHRNALYTGRIQWPMTRGVLILHRQ